jgi:ferredoxin
VRIIVKRPLCSGHARCASVAPEIFRLNDDGYIDMDDFDVEPGKEALARQGARACPERALRVAPGDDVANGAPPSTPTGGDSR